MCNSVDRCSGGGVGVCSTVVWVGGVGECSTVEWVGGEVVVWVSVVL